MDKMKAAIIAIVVIVIIAVGAFAFISANSHNTKIEVVSNDTLKNGDVVQIRLTDDYRNLYPNETVDVKILDDSGWGNTYAVKTDSEGQGSVNLVAYENGNYTIYSTYNGTLFNKQARDISPLTIYDGYG